MLLTLPCWLSDSSYPFDTHFLTIDIVVCSLFIPLLFEIPARCNEPVEFEFWCDVQTDYLAVLSKDLPSGAGYSTSDGYFLGLITIMALIQMQKTLRSLPTRIGQSVYESAC